MPSRVFVAESKRSQHAHCDYESTHVTDTPGLSATALTLNSSRSSTIHTVTDDVDNPFQSSLVAHHDDQTSNKS